MADDGAHESKSLHPAFALVRNGLAAAYAAHARACRSALRYVTSARAARLLGGDRPLEALDGGLDAPERLNTATIKAWPCCAQLFTPLDAIRDLLDVYGTTPGRSRRWTSRSTPMR